MSANGPSSADRVIIAFLSADAEAKLNTKAEDKNKSSLALGQAGITAETCT
jgi:hypothetical protein